MKRLITQTFVVIFIITLLAACTKEKTGTSVSTNHFSAKKTDLLDIPVYENAEEIYDIINTVNDFENIDQLISYETVTNRASIGRLSDNFYREINPSSFKDMQSAINFCINNKQYLDTIRHGDEISV